MTLSESKKIFSKIIDICYDVQHPLLNEALPSLEIDLTKADSISIVILLINEILVLLEEAIEDYQESREPIEQVQEMLELLFE